MKQFFGAMLLGVGILIAGLSGLCTLVMLGAGLFDPSTWSGSSEYVTMILPMAAIFGGIPFAIGLALFFAGRHLLRSDRQDRGG